ncbi:MAG: rRNA small subunit methyltransferase B, partial [Cellulomonadaceae bacterium]|nr:rRNA small subunit methyltransferase B [Cellulomonadaceae bacterium]
DHNDRRNSRGHERSAARFRAADNPTDRRRSAQAPSQRRKGTDPARMAAYDTLRAVDTSDSYANLVLPPMLRKRHITGRDAAFATELAYGTLRLRGRYDAILTHCTDRPLDAIDAPLLDVLRLGAHQVLGMRVPVHAACSETVGLARDTVGAGPSTMVNAVLRRVADKPLEDWLTLLREAAANETDALAAVGSHPVWITRALREALAGDGRDPADVAALLDADNTAPQVTVCARPGLVTPDALTVDAPEGFDLTPGRWAPTALTLAGGDPVRIPAVADGRAGVQDEGSQLVTLALTSVPLDGSDTRWLDMCAGPGGKAALLAALAAQRGATLVANEVAPHRARLVEQNLQAIPDGVATVRTGDGRDLGTDSPATFDRVLVDAPCTGLGALRRRPESRWRRTPKDLTALATLQRQLLASAIDATRPGGVIAYVTCSPHLAETRFVVDDVLRKRDDVTRIDAADTVRKVVAQTASDNIIPLSGDGGSQADGEQLGDRQGDVEQADNGRGDIGQFGEGKHVDIQLWPHVHGTDAMHLTLLRRL